MNNRIEMPICMMADFNKDKSEIALENAAQALAQSDSVDIYLLVDRMPVEEELTQVPLHNYETHIKICINGLGDHYVMSNQLVKIENVKRDGIGELRFKDNDSLWVFNYHFETKQQREELDQLMNGANSNG